MVLTTLLLNDIRDNAKTRIGTVATHGAIGTDNTAPTAGDTALGAEVFRDARDEFDDSAQNTAVVQLRVLTTEANGNTIAEAAFLNAATAGTMWNRNVITAITKTSDIQIFVDLQVTFLVTET